MRYVLAGAFSHADRMAKAHGWLKHEWKFVLTARDVAGYDPTWDSVHRCSTFKPEYLPAYHEINAAIAAKEGAK